MDILIASFLSFFLTGQDSVARVDTTAAGYQIGVYIGSFLPFIGLLIVFLLIIRSRYRFGSKDK
jgi:hypothetical protein